MKRKKIELITENHELKTKLLFLQDELTKIKNDVNDASWKILFGLIDNDEDKIQQGLDLLGNYITD